MHSPGRTSTRNSPEYNEDKSKNNIDIDFTQNSDAYFSLLTKLQKNAIKVRQKDVDQEKTLMEYLPVNEKFNLNKEGKVLTRWQERQRDWERIQTSISRKLDSKSARPLMMTTTDEYRAKIEEYDLIQAALPLKDRYSENSWQMTLRGGGPICIAIGHIFSGIECKVDVNVPKPKMIRKPKPAPATFKNDTFLDQTDSLTKKRKKYEKSIMEIRPHTLTYSDASNLVVRSSNLFMWAKESSAQYFREKEEDLLMSLREGENDEENPITAAEQNTIHISEDVRRETDESERRNVPQIDFTTSREILFDNVVNKNCTRSISFRNTSSISISYRWRRVNMEKSDKDKKQRGEDSADVLNRSESLSSILARKGTDDGKLRAYVIAQQRDRFFCLVDRGEILPDEVVSTLFTFSCHGGPGVFRSNWVLEFTPFDTSINIASTFSGEEDAQKLVGAVGVTMRAHCLDIDESMSSRAAMATFMNNRATETMARDIVQDCIRRVRTPVRLSDLQIRQITLFREVNAELLTTLGDTRYPTLLPLFVTPQRLDVFIDIFKRSEILYDEVFGLLTSLRQIASREPPTNISEERQQCNPFVVTNGRALEIRQILFPEKTIEIFDEVDESQIAPVWSYRLQSAMHALTALFDTVQQVEALEGLIAARNLVELKEKEKAEKRAARKLAANGNDSDEEEEEEEEEPEEDDEDAALRIKPPHALHVRTEGLLQEIHGGLNVLVSRPIDSQMLVDTARTAIVAMTERFNDWRSAALTDAGLFDLVSNGASIPPLPSPFTSHEGADAWTHALKQTSAIAEPVAPVKGAPKPPKNAPPPTGPTAQQSAFFYRQLYGNVREGLLSMADALFGQVNSVLTETAAVTDRQAMITHVLQTSLFDVAVVRAEDISPAEGRNRVVFVSLDGDAFTRADSVSSAFEVAAKNKSTAIQPVCKLVEQGAKAIVLLYEPSNPHCAEILTHFTEIQQLVNKKREEFIVTRNKELKKSKQAVPVYKTVKYMSCQSFAELNHRMDDVLRYGNFTSTQKKNGSLSSKQQADEFFSAFIPVILLQGFSFPGVVPAEPPYVEVESDDDEPPICVGVEENAALQRANWDARRPHRVSVDIDVGSGSPLTVQCYADASAAIKEAVSLAANQGDEVLWVDGAAERVFAPDMDTALRNLTPVVSERFVSEGLRESLLWTGVLQLLPYFEEHVSASTKLSEHLKRVFPVSSYRGTKPHGLAVLGGLIRSDKFRVFDQLIETMDTIFIVGELALPFMSLSGNVQLKRHSSICAEYRSLCTQLVQKARLHGCKLIWPCDVVHGDEAIKSTDRVKCFEKVEPDSRGEGGEYEGDLKTSSLVRLEDSTQTDDYITASRAEAGVHHSPVVVEGFVCDIGPETCKQLKETLAMADLVAVWGTAGVCELSSFQAGQQALVEGASLKISEETVVVADPSTLSKDSLVSVLLGDSCAEWFCRFLDSDGELGGDLVAAGAVSFVSRSSVVISGVLGRCASHLLAKLDGAVKLRPCADDEWVYSRRVVVVEEEEDEEDEDD